MDFGRYPTRSVQLRFALKRRASGLVVPDGHNPDTRRSPGRPVLEKHVLPTSRIADVPLLLSAPSPSAEKESGDLRLRAEEARDSERSDNTAWLFAPYDPSGANLISRSDEPIAAACGGPV